VTKNPKGSQEKLEHEDFIVHPEYKLPSTYKKNHKLIFSRVSLTTHEQNLFALFLIQLQNIDWRPDARLEIKIPAHKLSEWLNIESKNISTTIKVIAKRLQSRVIAIENAADSTEFESHTLFPSVKYADRQLSIIPNYELREFFVDTSKGYASINVMKLLRFNGRYTKTMYDILSRFKNPENRMFKIDMETLKGIFGIIDGNGEPVSGKSTLMDNTKFIEKVLVSSIAEIEQLCSEELIFFAGKDQTSRAPRQGITINRVGKLITSVTFEYLWIDQFIKQHPMDENTATDYALHTENRERTKKEQITQEELEKLAVAYYVIVTENPEDANSEKLRAQCVKIFERVFAFYRQKAGARSLDVDVEPEKANLAKLSKLTQLLDL
jgi:hypothetical protein